MSARYTASLLFVLAAPAWAGVLLEDVRYVGATAAGEMYEVRLGEALVYVAHDGDGGQTLDVQLHAPPGRTSAAFTMKDMDLSGALKLVGHVSLEGNDRRGYALRVAVVDGGTVDFVRQPDPQRILFRVVPPPEKSRRVERRPIEPATSEDPALAVDAVQQRGLTPPLNTSLAATVSSDAGVVETASPSATEVPVRGTALISSAPDAALVAARDALARGEYPVAIAGFTRALESEIVTVKKEALELLGVARDGNGQKAQAKAAWERYLVAYPDGEDAARVQQRLTGLVTRDLPTRTKLKAVTPDVAWNVTGSFSQFYQRQALNVSQGGVPDQEIVGIDALFTDTDIAVERRGEHLDIGLRVAGGNVTDFGPEDDASREYQLSVAYVEAILDVMDMTARLGRQTRYSGGVLGRFDGALVSVAPTQWLELTTIAGYPVQSSFDGPDTDRVMYGVSATFSLLHDHLELTPFWIQQDAGDLVDRRALGFETRYFSERTSVFSSVDYDVFHEELNNLYLFGNLLLPDELRLYASVDHRRSPYITTENALIGQPYDNISELERAYAEQEILDLAADRTAQSDVASVGVDKRFAARYDVGADASVADYSETPASGNVTATPPRRDYNYTLRFGANDVVGAGSYSSLYVRHADSDEVRTESVYLNTRLRFFKNVFLLPRLRADYQVWDLDQSRWRIAPSLRVDWRRSRGFGFELETGYEWSSRDLPTQTIDMDGYYLRIGYRSLF